MAFICHIHQISNVTRFVTDIIECILNHAISLWGKLFTAYWALYCIRLRPETYCVEGNIFHYMCEFGNYRHFMLKKAFYLMMLLQLTKNQYIYIQRQIVDVLMLKK